jgi:PAS domain S-box-containing protein
VSHFQEQKSSGPAGAAEFHLEAPGISRDQRVLEDHIGRLEARLAECEAALANKDTSLQFMTDLLPALVAYVDRDHRYRHVNRTFCEWYGRPADQIEGRTLEEVVTPQYLMAVQPFVDQVMRGEAVRFEPPVAYPFGGRTVEVRYTPDADAEGRVRGFAILVTDIGERRHAEEEQMRFGRLLDQAMEPLLIWELHGAIEYWNQAAEKLYGFTSSEAIGRVSHELLRTRHPVPLSEVEHRIETEGSWSGELQHRTKSGNVITVESRHRLIEEPSGRKLVLESNRDITARKRMEEDLRRMNETLERKVRERTEELVETNRELEAFSYSVSHDLRAPLRSVDGFGRILLRDYLGKVVDSRAEHYIRRMSLATVRMGHLIDDLLNLSRVSRTALQKSTVNLSDAAREIWAELSAQDPGRNIRMTCADKVMAYGDPRLLRIVIQNLLGNAWKFTAGKAEGLVEFGCRHEEGEPRYFVCDNGAGFDMAYAEQLFVPFQRLHQPGEFEGSGIGLAIVHRILRRHGGRIWAHASPGEGAVFTFTLSEEKGRAADDTAG